MRSKEYWKDRHARLLSNLEKDEDNLLIKLNKYYEIQSKALEKQIGNFYGMYGENNVIEYRKLLKEMSEAEKGLLYQDFTEFMSKYPQYSHLEPIRGQIYKLDRLEGLRVSMLVEQMKIAGYEQAEIEKHLYKTFDKVTIDSLNVLGFGSNFNTINSDLAKKIINKNWVGGENFSQRIWKNRELLANHLTDEFRNAVIRGDSYRQCTNVLLKKFNDVSRRNAERLVKTEGTYVMNEASITTFEKEFEQYRYSAIFDERTSEVCKALDGQVFDMKKRQAGSNFPPMHPWCRSGYEVVIPEDWIEKKLEEISKQNIDKGVDSPDKEGYNGLNRHLNRKDRNIGVFKNLEIPMQKRQVKKIANKYGIDLKGITIKIQRSEGLLKTTFAGSTDYLNVGRIDLFPNAFMNEEQLIRTLVHEKVHVEQLKKYGFAYTQKHLSEMEVEAYRIESEFIKNIKRKGKK